MTRASRSKSAWIFLGLLQAAFVQAQAQNPDTLAIRIPPMAEVTDSAIGAMPASHRTAEPDVDQPVTVTYCPQPSYPKGLADYGFEGQVELRFVIDTLGLAELQDLVVTRATHIGFVEPARRAIGKCRYRPALKAGRPVRFLVQQRVVFRQSSEPPE